MKLGWKRSETIVLTFQLPLVPIMLLTPSSKTYPFANFWEFVPCMVVSYCAFYVVYSLIERRVGKKFDGLPVVTCGMMTLCIIVKHALIGFDRFFEPVSND